MDIKKISKFLESGQMIPFIVIALLALIAMAALVLDGGGIMMNRRTAQAAADAGAIAGARVLCRNNQLNMGAIGNAVHRYTTQENNAALIHWEVTSDNVGNSEGLARGEVVVTAEVQNTSFFAGIFGQNTLSAQATAGAGCFPYNPNIVLPIAYPCRLPTEGSVSQDCDYFPLAWSEIEAVTNKYNYDPRGGNPTTAQAKGISDDLFAAHSDKIYIVVDSNNLCGQGLNCNFSGNDEGRYQLNSGIRGWLNLEGTNSGNPNLWRWIDHGVETGLRPHTWLSFIPGNRANSIYPRFNNRLDEIVWVPVINWICNSYPSPGSDCDIMAKERFPLPPGWQTIVLTGSPAYPVGHVVGFAPFFPTCVKTAGNPHGPTCPGFTLARQHNSSIKHNTLAVEGYFVEPDSLPGDTVGAGGADLGIYIVSLTR